MAQRKRRAFPPPILPLVALPLATPVVGYFGVMLAPVYGKDLIPGTGGLLDFDTIKPRATPNEFVSAPVGRMPAFESFQGNDGETDRWQEAPVYNVSAAELKEKFFRMLDNKYLIRAYAQPTASDELKDQYVFVQRTLLFRFPDVVNVQFISLGRDQSTLAVHSGSVYGVSDLGKNMERVKDWLEALED